MRDTRETVDLAFAAAVFAGVLEQAVIERARALQADIVATLGAKP